MLTVEELTPMHGALLTLSSIVFFSFVNFLLKVRGPPKGLTEAPWRYRNVYVSWLHALLASHWAVLCLLLEPTLLHDMFGHVTVLSYACVCFSTGYFTYDLLDTVVHRHTLRNWQVVAHHIANGTAFYYNIFYKAHMGYNIVAFLLEINTVFLHWRELLQWTTPWDAPSYLLVKHLNLLTYLPFRVMATCVISTIFFRHFDSEPVFILVVLAVACPLMHILNFVLLYRLVENDLLRGPGGSKVSAWTTIKRDVKIILGIRERQELSKVKSDTKQQAGEIVTKVKSDTKQQAGQKAEVNGKAHKRGGQKVAPAADESSMRRTTNADKSTPRSDSFTSASKSRSKNNM